MFPPVRTILVALAGVALLVPAIGTAAVRQDPPVTTPETIPLPPDPALPVEPVVILDQPESVTITIEVPALPEPVVAEPTRKPPKLARPPAPARRVTPTAATHLAEPETQRRADVAPVATKKPTPKAKPQKKLKQPKRKVMAPVSAPQGLIRNHMPAHGVLAAQFSSQDAALPATLPATMHRAVLYVPLAAAVLLGILLGLVGAAPALAVRWPQVFGPVIDASERIVLAGVCLTGVVLTMAITWALTGPGAWTP